MRRARRSPAPIPASVLQKLTDTDLSNEAFPWLTGKKISVGPAESLDALRVNFVGELGYELHHPIEMQNTIFDLLCRGRPGVRHQAASASAPCWRWRWRSPTGSSAASSRSNMPRSNPASTASSISTRAQFLGRDALVVWRERGFRNRFVTMEVHDVTDADARGSEPILLDGEMVGRCT